jgi:hypothetical protein
MDFFRTGKLRFLYWLALAQLVGGPLVLLQVTVFCKLALHETPRVGVAQAAVRAWQSGDFQALLAATDELPSSERKSAPPADGQKLKLEKGKLPVIPWEPAPLTFSDASRYCKIVDRARTWTPAWPQAPPGPPPRVG